MSGIKFIGTKFIGLDLEGNPAPFGKLYTYQQGTEINKTTWADEAKTIPNTNPVILDAAGLADVFMDGTYTLDFDAADDSDIWDEPSYNTDLILDWVNSFEATYVSSTSFTMNGNRTLQYVEAIDVRLVGGPTEYYGTVNSASYGGGVTTVVLNESIVPVGLTFASTSASADGLTASGVILRATNLLAQDDFDRSILFTDGDGFTAGAGPHVFTVTADYTPTDSDFRVYKKDSAGVFSRLIVTGETATQFTYGSTLAGTDTVFVGDNTNRELAVFPSSTSANNSATYSESLNISAISGDFTAGSFSVSKIGNMVNFTMHQGWSHVSDATPQSASGLIPVGFRPDNNVYLLCYVGTTRIYRVQITPTGQVSGYQIDTVNNVSVAGVFMQETCGSWTVGS